MSERGHGSSTDARIRDLYEAGRPLAMGVDRLASDPAVEELTGGEVWYNTSADEYRGYEAGTGIVALSTTTV